MILLHATRAAVVNRKYVIGAIVVAVLVLLVIFVGRPTAKDSPSSVSDLPADPADSAMTGEGGFAAPVDRSARWGFVLNDDIVLVDEPVAAGATPAPNATLHTGDQVYIGDADSAHPNQLKVALFDGRSGWIEKSKVFEATNFAPWDILENSTAPVKDWIPEELVPPANLPQYRIVISSEFLMRASKNPNPVISEWVQAVLSAQAAQ